MIEETGGVDTLTVDARLEVQVLGGGAPRPSRQGDLLSSSHLLPLFHVVLGVVGIKGLRTILMFNDDTLTIAIVNIRHRDHTVIDSIDRIIRFGLQIYARMPMGASVVLIGTNHLGTRQRVTTGVGAIRQILGMAAGCQYTQQQQLGQQTE